MGAHMKVDGGFRWQLDLANKIKEVPFKDLLKIIFNKKNGLKLNGNGSRSILFLSGVMFGYLLFYLFWRLQ